MKKYRKRPLTVEAEQWNGSGGRAIEIVDTVNANGGQAMFHEEPRSIAITTSEGIITVSPWDWVTRGTLGEWYPIKPAVFENVYEPAE